MTPPDQPTEWLPPAAPVPQYPAASAGGSWQPPPPAPAAVPAGWHPPLALPATRFGGLRRPRGLVVALGLVAVLVVGSALAGGWLYLNRAPRLNYLGKRIDHPNQALAKAQTNLDALVAGEPVNRGAQAGCYYGVPATGSGSQRWNVSQGIFCGPIAMLGTGSVQQWAHYLLNAKEHGGLEQLTPEDFTANGGLEQLPDAVQLVRPGSGQRHTRFTTVPEPIPPAAAADAFVSVDQVGYTGRSDASVQTSMYSDDGGVELTYRDQVPYYGKQAQARSAAPGHKLVSFQVEYRGPKDASITDLDLGVSVDGSSLRKIPDPTYEGRYKVLSVPSSAKSVDLVLRFKSYVEKISLLTGKADPGNITLFTRDHWQDKLAISKDLPITFQSSAATLSGTLHLKISEADLEFFEDVSGQKAPTTPQDAFLHLRMSFLINNIADSKNSELLPKLLTFRSKTGRIVHGHELETASSRYSYIVFDVPGDCTGGTVTIGGTDGAGDLRLTLPQPFSFPVSFPAG